MRRLAETVAATAAAISVLAGCGSQENQTSPNDPMLEGLFEETQHYWEAQGVSPDTQLATVQRPGDRFFCHNTKNTSDSNTMNVLRDSTSHIAQYCVGENTVVVMGNSYEYERDFNANANKLSPRAYARYVVSHELGHHLEDIRNEDIPGDASTGERRADCYAGAAVAGLAPQEVPMIAAYLSASGETDESHGTGEQRKAAFMAGASAPDGANCGQYHDGATVYTS